MAPIHSVRLCRCKEIMISIMIVYKIQRYFQYLLIIFCILFGILSIKVGFSFSCSLLGSAIARFLLVNSSSLVLVQAVQQVFVPEVLIHLPFGMQLMMVYFFGHFPVLPLILINFMDKAHLPIIQVTTRHLPVPFNIPSVRL